MAHADPFEAWLAAVEARFRSELSFPELRRAVQSLSSLYVERRDEWRSGGPAPLGSAGRRAAFASYYAPLHFLTLRHICRELGAAAAAVSRIVDLGCGTGASGAAWALETAIRGGETPATVVGYDRHPWAVEEARFTYRLLGIDGRALRGDLTRVRLPRDGAILLAYSVNELPDPSRRRLLAALVRTARQGARILVVEPISRRLSPWWAEWADALRAEGARADEWSFPVELPEPVLRLDRAAGLDHGVLRARSLWV
jgi:SAM-dependent methyltransferase